MRLKVICVGKASGPFRQLSVEYEQRIRRYAQLDVVEVEEAKYRGLPPAAEIARLQEKEAEGIRSELRSRWYTVLLDVAGSSLTSEGLARFLEERAVRSEGDVAFVVGGSLGLSPSLSASARFSLSLSAMTLPHPLARVVLMEQLYRALTIHRGEPYHK